MERSTDQVIKPINPEALTSWVGKIPVSIVDRMNSIAPMLQILGYDPTTNLPDYGKMDAFVEANMRSIIANRSQWLQKSEAIVKQRLELRDKLETSNKDKQQDKVYFKANKLLIENEEENHQKT